MVRYHAGRAWTSEVFVCVAVTALYQRHQQQRGEQQRARKADTTMTQRFHRVDFG